ncbi:MAG: TVP38/TMEM64 family protein [Candidatus Velthaea sp.]
MLKRRLTAILIFGISFALAAFVVAEKRLVDEVMRAVGPLAVPVGMMLFAIVASAPFSVTDALAVSNGVLFGPWIGALVNAGGLVLAAILSYYVARRTSKLLDIESQIEHLPAWARRFKPGSPMFLIAVRLIPGMGGTIATQTAAAMRVPLWRQVYTMCAVTVPVCTALAFGGHAISAYVQTRIFGPAQHFAERHHVHMPRRKAESPAPNLSPSP